MILALPVTFVTGARDLVVPPEAHTLAGFREWVTSSEFPEKVRVHFSRGEIQSLSG